MNAFLSRRVDIEGKWVNRVGPFIKKMLIKIITNFSAIKKGETPSPIHNYLVIFDIVRAESQGKS